VSYLQTSTRKDAPLAGATISDTGSTAVKGDPDGSANAASQVIRITADLLRDACQLLHDEFSSDISVETWMSQFQYPWLREKPDYGVALFRPNEGIVGVFIAIYSDQMIDGKVERFCNVGSWYVKPRYRGEGIRLLRALMKIKNQTLTSFSTIPDTVKIGCALGWKKLDEHVYLIPNFGFFPGARKLRVLTSFDEIFATVDERHKQIMSDHGRRIPARYVLVTDGNSWCFSVHKKQARRGIEFTVPIYLSDRILFRRWIAHFLSAYRSLDGCWMTLCPPRFLPNPPAIRVRLAEPAPAIFKSKGVAPEDVTELYTETMTLPVGLE
jgi:hypothetical protein